VHEKWGLEPHIHPAEQPVLDRAGEAALRWQLPFENYQGPVHYLKEGDKLNWAGETFDILFTPGHSPGSISFYHEKQGFVLSGDVLFRGSIGRTDLPGGDYALLEQSIRQKMYRLPDATKVYPGHGLPTSIEVERKSNPFVKGEEYD
jgi:glyoxylase-like metal-dependent hydrolase (beta-lactamase superfamily II)